MLSNSPSSLVIATCSTLQSVLCLLTRILEFHRDATCHRLSLIHGPFQLEGPYYYSIWLWNIFLYYFLGFFLLLLFWYQFLKLYYSYAGPDSLCLLYYHLHFTHLYLFILKDFLDCFLNCNIFLKLGAHWCLISKTSFLFFLPFIDIIISQISLSIQIRGFLFLN